MNISQNHKDMMANAYNTGQKECGLKIGDTVKVLAKCENFANGWGTGWNALKMNPSIGRFLTVQSISNRIGIMLSNGYYYPYFVLEKTSKQPILVKLNEEYTAEVNEKEIKVGCIIFPLSIAHELHKAVTEISR
jgi:hypothetical protein